MPRDATHPRQRTHAKMRCASVSARRFRRPAVWASSFVLLPGRMTDSNHRSILPPGRRPRRNCATVTGVPCGTGSHKMCTSPCAVDESGVRLHLRVSRSCRSERAFACIRTTAVAPPSRIWKECMNAPATTGEAGVMRPMPVGICHAITVHATGEELDSSGTKVRISKVFSSFCWPYCAAAATIHRSMHSGQASVSTVHRFVRKPVGVLVFFARNMGEREIRKR